MADYYYGADRKRNGGRLQQLGALAPAASQAWEAFDQAAFADGAIDARTKQLLGVAIGHVTGCPYCIDFHTRLAKRAGATDAQLAEAVFVAMAMSAGKAWGHACIAMETLEAVAQRGR